MRATANAPYPTLGSAMRQLKTLCRAAGSPRHGGPRPSLPRILYIYQKAARGLCGAKGPARRRGDVGPPKYPKDGRRLPYSSAASPETDREGRSRRPRDWRGRAGVAPWPASSVRRAPAPLGNSQLHTQDTHTHTHLIEIATIQMYHLPLHTVFEHI